VTDANGQRATDALSITVNAAPVPLTITTTSLPDGTQNSAYSTTLAASGGQTPYSWSLSAGTLPAGLALATSTGVISGTPSGTGTSSFTVRVTDANGQTATQALSITINPVGGSVSLSVGLRWDASTSPVAGYNLYRATTSGGPYTKLNSTVIAGTSYTDNTVVAGRTYYYVVKSVDSTNTESVPSNEVTAGIF
jgi:Tfp pilus assembly protein PilX